MVQNTTSSRALGTANTRFGSLTIIKGDTVISRALQLYGEWAQLEIDSLAPFLSQGDVAIDVGAYIGTHSLAFSSLVGPTGKVLTFEPHRPVLSILKENIRNAAYDNIRVHNCALGAVDESLRVRRLSLLDEANFGGLSLRDPIYDHDLAERVMFRRLDSMSFERVDFLKADVEGMEIDVLNGAEATIARCRPIIFAECNSLRNTVPLLEWSKSHKYVPYGLLARAFNPNNFAGNQENCFGDSSETGVLFLPEEKATEYSRILKASNLPKIRGVDDLALLLLHKPQYPPEVLAQTDTAAALGTWYPSPLSATRAQEIAQLSQQIEERDNRLNTLTQSESEQYASLLERESRIAALTLSLTDREATIVQQASVISTLLHAISERDVELAERNSRIAALPHLLAEKESVIADLRNQLVRRAELVEEQNAHISEKKAQIDLHARSLSEKETRMALQDARLSSLRRAVVERDLRVINLSNSLFRIDTEFSEITAQLEVIQESRSWKLTKPLRHIATTLGLQRLNGNLTRESRRRRIPTGRENNAGNYAEMVEQVKSEFNVASYLLHYRDVAAARIDPILHYLKYGAAELRDPSPEFSTRYYVDTNPDVKAAGINPFLHYVLAGRSEGRSPMPPEVFPGCDATEFSGMLDRLRPEFDIPFYLQQYPDIAVANIDPIAHYLLHGASEMRDPSPEFCTKYYLATNPDVKAAAVNPFLHFVLQGRREGRSPRPPETEADRTGDPINFAGMMDVLKAEFDVPFYLQEYPDVATSNIDPVDHYLEQGAAQLHDPSPNFSTKFYLDTNPDVEEAGINPYLHYVLTGRREGRSPRPNGAHQRIGPIEIAEMVERLRPEFSIAYYRQGNPDVANADIDPIAHYIKFGAAEHRDPSPNFCTKYYLDTNPDVKAAGINPFFHFLVAGRNEGRSAVHPGGYRARHLEQLLTLSDTVRNWTVDVRKAHTASVEGLIARFEEKIGTNRTRVVLSFGHDNYTATVGGVQSCIHAEELAFEEMGIVYVNFHPSRPLPVLASSDDSGDLLLNIVCRGEFLGSARVETIESALKQLAGRVGFSLTIHALHGHAPEAIARIAKSARVPDAVFWVHDYFSICPGYNLLRNGVSYCGAPPVTSTACSVCVYGEERANHLPRMKALFNAVEFVVVAPSAAALEIWKSRSELQCKETRIQPHCRIHWSQFDQPRATRKERGALRIAFLGFPVILKGWPVFKNLLDEFSANSNFEFHYLGDSSPDDDRLKVTQVAVSRENRGAMVDAIAQNEIDFAILWSLSPETFSFTTFEVAAGGAHILTYRDSGNIARVVSETSLGRVFESESDLFEFFRSGEAQRYVKEKPRSVGPAGRLAFGGMTAELLGTVKK